METVQASMTVVSVNVGLPKTVTFRDTEVTTGIFKEPVSGRIQVRTLNLEGDGQADLTVHGGVDKAIYFYPSEHYAPWQAEEGRAFSWGQFGENITTAGMVETEVRIGDRFRLGTALVEVSQPRMPCHKLALRMDDIRFPKKFLAANRSGFYARVVEEGAVEAGDAMVLQSRGPEIATVATVFEQVFSKQPDGDLLEALSQVDALPEAWRDDFREKRARHGSA